MFAVVHPPLPRPPSPPKPALPRDSLLGTHTAALYISLRYHALHGAYIYDRVNALAAHHYRQALLLVEVDVPTPAAALTELAGLALRSGITLLTASHPREAGRLLETLRVYEHKRPDGIEGPRPADGYAPALTAFLTAVRPVNKADVVALARGVGGVADIATASAAELRAVPGMGGRKVDRLYRALHAPFPPQPGGGGKAVGEGG